MTLLSRASKILGCDKNCHCGVLSGYCEYKFDEYRSNKSHLIRLTRSLSKLDIEDSFVDSDEFFDFALDLMERN